MKRPGAVFTIALALGAIILAPRVGAQARDRREEGPIEIEKCQVINQSGSYVLVNNLTGQNPMNNNCLFITASFVTIDLAGFSISGRAGTDGAAVAAFDPHLQGIAVRNGTMVGGADAVILEGIGSIVEGLRAFEDPSFPGIGGGIIANGIVKGNFVSGRVFGISATGTVTGNFVENNQLGIFVGEGSTVIGNTALNNGNVGIAVACPANVTDNTAVGNGQNLQLNGNGCNNTNNVAP